MVERRTMIGGTMIAGLAGLLAPPQAAAAAAERDGSDNDERVASAIDDLRRSLDRQFDSTELGPSAYVSRIRQVQRMHLAATQHYPAFIEVGIDVFEHLYDWHVKSQQRLDARQLPDGRYAMTFMFTTLLLRPDQDPAYVSSPYDILPRV